MKPLKQLLAIGLLALGAASALAQTATDDMTDGEIRKVDKDTKQLTIRHAEIKNLDMPGMTMVFKAGDPAMLDAVKPGDKVRFKAEKQGSALVVTALLPATER